MAIGQQKAIEGWRKSPSPRKAPSQASYWPQFQVGVTLLGYTDLCSLAVVEGALFPESRPHVKVDLPIHRSAECWKWVDRESLVVETGWGSGDFIIMGRMSGFDTGGLVPSGPPRTIQHVNSTAK